MNYLICLNKLCFCLILIIQWPKPAITTSPITTPAFLTGGIEGLPLTLPTAVVTPTIVAAKPIWLPILLRPLPIVFPAYLDKYTWSCKFMSLLIKHNVTNINNYNTLF